MIHLLSDKDRLGKVTKSHLLYISNSWGTNSLKMNVVTTPTSTPHSNRV